MSRYPLIPVGSINRFRPAPSPSTTSALSSRNENRSIPFRQDRPIHSFQQQHPEQRRIYPSLIKKQVVCKQAKATKENTMLKIIPAAILLFLAACTVNAQTVCTSTADCEDEVEYCAAGICTIIGSCASRDDCFNPNNGPYALVTCVGLVDCIDGQCGVICGPETCPNGQAETPCDPEALPCDTTDTCDAADTCVNDFCGGECSAKFYDTAGSVVECSGSVPTQLPANPNEGATADCASDADCEGVLDNAYCASGVCTQNGFCSTDVDCKNPSNSYAVIECVGPITCDAGQCGRTCGPTGCPEGVPEVQCIADPCLDFKFGCPAAESCVANFCGECSAILFDQAGFDLGDCMPVDPVNSTINFADEACMSDMDCDEDHYCGDGVCLGMGECTQRIDCWNPANIYGIAMCVGLIDCREGPNSTMVCSIECGPKECPGGEERVPCPEPTTCNVTNCDEAVSCNFDGCGGECTEIYFDEAGTQVCVEEKTACFSDADCNPVAEARQAFGEGSYCAQGVCMEKGTCMTDLDCMNPKNERPTPACIGYPSCEIGQCTWTCGPACADGSDGSVCESNPCADSSCAAAASCVNDYCSGGCDTIFFDAAGNEVTDCEAVAMFTSNNSGASSTMFSLIAFLAISMSAILFA